MMRKGRKGWRLIISQVVTIKEEEEEKRRGRTELNRIERGQGQHGGRRRGGMRVDGKRAVAKLLLAAKGCNSAEMGPETC